MSHRTPLRPTQSTAVWPIIRANKLSCLAAGAAGLGCGLFAKYIAAAFLILWLLAGAQ